MTINQAQSLRSKSVDVTLVAQRESPESQDQMPQATQIPPVVERGALVQIEDPQRPLDVSAQSLSIGPGPWPQGQPKDHSDQRVSQATMKLIDEATRRFRLIERGDRVAVGCSGGKDSLMMIAALRALQRRDDYDFEMRVIHLDQRQPGFERSLFDESIALLGVECQVITRDTWSVVESQRKPGQIPCAVCGRLRRGILNRWCAENGFNKLALGHHLDDALETFMLNLLFGRRLDPLKPLTEASDVPVATIRPLILVEERKIEAWIARSGLSPVPCPVCDSFPDAKRRDLKGLLRGLSEAQPELYASTREAIYGERSPLDFAFVPRGARG